MENESQGGKGSDTHSVRTLPEDKQAPCHVSGSANAAARPRVTVNTVGSVVILTNTHRHTHQQKSVPEGTLL